MTHAMRQFSLLTSRYRRSYIYIYIRLLVFRSSIPYSRHKTNEGVLHIKLEKMDTCSFTFISSRTNLPCDVYGIERTWENLQREFDRQSGGLPNARYYETFGPGPLLFAVIGDTVYYHEVEIDDWHFGRLVFYWFSSPLEETCLSFDLHFRFVEGRGEHPIVDDR